MHSHGEGHHAHQAESSNLNHCRCQSHSYLIEVLIQAFLADGSQTAWLRALISCQGFLFVVYLIVS